MLIWTFVWTALSLNDAKRDLTFVEIVYCKSMMAACSEKTTLKIQGNCFMTCFMLLSVEFWCAIAPDAPFNFLHRNRSVTYHLLCRSPEYLTASLHLPPSVAVHHIVWERTPGPWNRREVLPSKVCILLLRLSVHLPHSASSVFLAGGDVLLFPRAPTTVPYSWILEEVMFF